MLLAGVAAAMAAVALSAAPAAGRDSLAPAGSSDHWLPKEDWVYRHWLPFAQADLERELGLGPGQLEAFLFDDRRTLVELARAKGMDPAALRDRLVAPVVSGLGPDRAAVVRERAWRVLTQGHLAQHLLFHPYHGLDVRANAPAIFGLTPRHYQHERLTGRTPLQLIAAHGGTRATLRGALDRLYVVDADEGLRLQVTGRAATTEMLARRRAELRCWMRSPVPGKDPGQPYVEQHKIEGRRATVTTAAQLAADERIIERYRRALPRSCWSVPARWRGPVVRPARGADPDPGVTTAAAPATLRREPRAVAAPAAAATPRRTRRAAAPAFVCDL